MDQNSVVEAGFQVEGGRVEVLYDTVPNEAMDLQDFSPEFCDLLTKGKEVFRRPLKSDFTKEGATNYTDFNAACEDFQKCMYNLFWEIKQFKNYHVAFDVKFKWNNDWKDTGVLVISHNVGSIRFPWLARLAAEAIKEAYSKIPAPVVQTVVATAPVLKETPKPQIAEPVIPAVEPAALKIGAQKGGKKKKNAKKKSA